MDKGRTVIVTGAAGGLGRPIVDRFLVNGDFVIATGRAGPSLERFRAERKDQSRLKIVAADLTGEFDCARVVDAARQENGRVDVLINVAGSYPIQSFDETSVEDFRRVVDINLTTVFAMIKAAHPLMRGRGWGRVVTIGSAAIYEGVATQIHYVAAKAGIIGLSRSLAQSFGPDGITVNTVTPGLTLTPRVRENFPEELRQMLVERRALKREEQPEDVVGAVFFLASPDADLITGQTLNVDGGTTML